MNREIKFRVWDKQEKRMMEWNELVQKNYDIGFIFNHSHRFIPSQFTGLLDKNGKEIYEGHILKYGMNQTVVEWGAEECYEDIAYGWNLYTQKDRYEIIGNVFENPELKNQEE